jgi:hypothetical protein
MKDIKVKCRTCGCVDMYETTEHYNPDIPLTGNMLQLQQPYRTFNWPVYEGALADKSTSRFRMYCTRCNGLISTTGKLDFVDREKDEMILGNAEDSIIGSTIDDMEKPVKLVLERESEPTYAEKMAKMRHKPKKKRRK